MASLGGRRFDATQHDTEQRDYENLPEGIYVLEVTESELKEDKGAHKAGLKLTYDVIEPAEYKGRKIFAYINIEHPNVQAQEIGQKELASLARAVGETNEFDDSEVLHLRAFTAKVGLGKPSKEKNADGTPTYPAKNEIKRFYFPDADDVPAPSVAAPAAANDNRRPPANDNRTAAQPAAAAAATAGKARPWGKK